MVNKNDEVRNAWIENKLKSLESGKRLLDAGAGRLKYKPFCNHLIYVSQDFCQYSGTGDSKGLQTGEWDTSKIDIVSDIIDIPVEDGSFDAVLCSEVIEHVPDPLAAIKELARVLKKGGELYLTAPFCSLTHFAPYHFSTGFNKYYYETFLPQNGIEIKEITSYGDFYSFLQQELGRLPSIVEKYNNHNMSRGTIRAIGRINKELEKLYFEKNESCELLCFGYMVHGVKQS